MTTPAGELLAAVPSLNQPDQPFTFTVEADRIVGRWDIVRATSLYPDQVTHVDKQYKIVVELDTDGSTYDFEETSSDSEAELGKGGLSWSRKGFKGKSMRKEFGFEFGGVSKTDDGVTVGPVTYSFETSRIKQPLFAFLEQHGWQRKRGFLARLFGR